MANIGHQQVRCGSHVEPPLVTAGDDLTTIARFLPESASTYSAADVINALLPIEAPLPPVLSPTSTALCSV